MRKKASLITLTVILLGLIVLKLWDAKLFDVYPYLKISLITYQSILSILITTLCLLYLKKTTKRRTIFRSLSLLAASFLLSFLFITRSEFEKIDYLFSTPVETFEHEVKVGRAFWTYHTFTVDTDTINLSQNARREKIHEGEFELYKSNLTHHYHVRPKTK